MDREAGRDGMDMPESVTMGGGDSDSFEAVRARLQWQKDYRVSQKADRLSGILEREQQREQNFISQLGFDPATLAKSGGRITIAPRI